MDGQRDFVLLFFDEDGLGNLLKDSQNKERTRMSHRRSVTYLRATSHLPEEVGEIFNALESVAPLLCHQRSKRPATRDGEHSRPPYCGQIFN